MLHAVSTTVVMAATVCGSFIIAPIATLRRGLLSAVQLTTGSITTLRGSQPLQARRPPHSLAVGCDVAVNSVMAAREVTVVLRRNMG